MDFYFIVNVFLFFRSSAILIINKLFIALYPYRSRDRLFEGKFDMKAGLLAPLYLSVSWVLTVSYQLFTDTAVRTIGTGVGSFWPNVGGWITSNIQTIVFIYAFTWIFVLSSVIPSVILGKQRGILTQYIVVLTLSLIAFFMPDILLAMVGIDINQALLMAIFLENPGLAGIYLAVPYLFMLGLDLRSRRIAKLQAIEWNKVTYPNHNPEPNLNMATAEKKMQ